MNKIYLYSIIFMMVFALIGCGPSSSIISLNNSPSDVVLTSIDPLNIEIEYQLRSRIKDPYIYKNRAGYKFIIPIHSPYRSHINSILSTKFLSANSSNSNAPIKILFELAIFEVKYDNIQNFTDVLVGSGDANVIANIVSNVAIFDKNGVIAEREIETKSRYNERIRDDTKVEDVYEKAANDVLNKHMIMVHNFIRTLEKVNDGH